MEHGMRSPLHRLVPPEAVRWADEYRRSIVQQVLLQEIVRTIGKTEGQTAADVGLGNPVLSLLLRRLGGSWQTVALTDEAEAAAKLTLKDAVHRLTGGCLPFANKSMDLIVLAGVLERLMDDDAFIEDCHRVLKPTGRLVIETAHRKTGSLIPPLERFLDRDPGAMGLPRAGYNESDIFQLLKHGFDVSQVRSYLRFFTRLNALLSVATYERSIRLGRTDRILRRLRFLGRVAAWFAFQMDYLIWFTRGFRLIVTAKRRAWLPRKTPVLSDGRSISEAVLTRAPK